MASSPPRPLDAAPDQWLRRRLPAWALPFAELARFDRPIGAWLLLFPCWWGLGLGVSTLLTAGTATSATYGQKWPVATWAIYAALFWAGAFIMRGAGCTYNDIIDRDFDAQVARTAGRPLPSGRVSVGAAWVFAIGLSLLGFVILIQFNWLTIVTGIASLALVALYPFAKRFTGWPQVVLGLVFKWGALVGYTAATGRLDGIAIALYLGCVLWTVGYDTIYAHQDARDDPRAGVRSTALTLGGSSHVGIGLLYAGAWLIWAIVLWVAGTGWPLMVAMVAVAGHFAWQVVTLDTTNPANCLTRFKANRSVGFLLTAGFLGHVALALTR
jgi:4-hydroxybenzoate polyprenyltransferase